MLRSVRHRLEEDRSGHPPPDEDPQVSGKQHSTVSNPLRNRSVSTRSIAMTLLLVEGGRRISSHLRRWLRGPCYHLVCSPYISEPACPTTRSRDCEASSGVVTGAGRGIGRPAPSTLASHGARVLLADLDEGLLDAVAGRIRGDGGEVATTRDRRPRVGLGRGDGAIVHRDVRRDRLRGRERRDRRLQRPRHRRPGTVAACRRDQLPRGPPHGPRGPPADAGPPAAGTSS